MRDRAATLESNQAAPKSRKLSGVSTIAYPRRPARISTARIRLGCVVLMSVTRYEYPELRRSLSHSNLRAIATARELLALCSPR